MDENKENFLKAVEMPEKTFDNLTPDVWFIMKGISSEKVRLAFKCTEPPKTFNDWTAVTISEEHVFKLPTALSFSLEQLTEK
jgi:hypothetical protein